MIRRLDHVTNLAVVGMSVVVPNGGGIEEFGRLVYRGLPVTGQFGETITLKDAVVRSIQQACGEGLHHVGRVPIISLSPSITMILQNDNDQSLVQEVVGILPAFAMVSDWLESGTEDVVLLVEKQENPQTVSALLITDLKSALDNIRPVYALLTSAAIADSPMSAAVISGTLKEAQRVSGIQPGSIGFIETATLRGTNITIEETEGLGGALDSQQPFKCALGSGLDGLLAIAKIAWCLSRRIIPGVPGWEGLIKQDSWQNSPFYVPLESRSWFIPTSQGKRIAGLNLLTANGSFIHFLFSEATFYTQNLAEAPRQEALRLFPLAANSIEQLIEKLENLKSKLTVESNLIEISQVMYKQYMVEKPAAKFVTGLLSQTSNDLLRETGFAAKGIPIAYEKQADWQTPLGSFFTPHPLGKDGKVSFVYPGAFNSYPGIGRDLFYLFPTLFEHLSGITEDIGNLLNEQLLYPRSINALTSDDLSAIETQLNGDPITMLISGSCLAVLYTDILRNVFKIHPASAFGYSLGEVSMMFATRVWTEADGTSKSLKESPLFRTRLTGPQNAVREYWNLSLRGENDHYETLWINYILMTGPERVKMALKDETRVYLTHINTPHQVAIGGDPSACRRVIDRLKCKSLQAPFNYAIHCEPIHSEYDMLTDLHSIPVMGQPGMILYSSATHLPMPINQRAIAEQIAYELCHCLDFPYLIQVAYNDGARIFLELGAGSNCARWINETLQGQPHAAYSINRKGVDDHTSILRLMARMVSQHVPVDLSALYQD